MNNKWIERAYWATTVLFCGAMALAGVAYLTQEPMRDAFVHLGYPNYFRIELAVAKWLGAVALLTPVPALVKHWAYAGFGITLVSAVVSHLSCGDPMGVVAAPLMMGLVFVASYVTYLRRSTI